MLEQGPDDASSSRGQGLQKEPPATPVTGLAAAVCAASPSTPPSSGEHKIDGRMSNSTSSDALEDAQVAPEPSEQSVPSLVAATPEAELPAAKEAETVATEGAPTSAPASASTVAEVEAPALPMWQERIFFHGTRALAALVALIAFFLSVLSAIRPGALP